MGRKTACYEREKYSAEFKAEAVEFVRMSSGSVSAAARDLGLSPTMLNRWYREVQRSRKGEFQGSGSRSDQELVRLKRELAQVKTERDFLRDATIQGCRSEYPVQLMCRCLKVSTCGFYDWANRSPSKIPLCVRVR